MERYARVFKPTEVKMMLASFSNMETIHIAAYALLLETIGMPESEFAAFLEYEAMKAKHDYMQTLRRRQQRRHRPHPGHVRRVHQGLQLFASFAMLMNFPRFNKMKGMGQIVSWSVRDESLHCEGMVKLYHAFRKETGCVTKAVADDIVDCCKTVVGWKTGSSTWPSRWAPVQGMTADDIKSYIRFIADWRLRQLGCQTSRGEGKPAALAAGAALRGRARQLLRGPRHGIFQGRYPRPLGWAEGSGRSSTRCSPAAPRRRQH